MLGNFTAPYEGDVSKVLRAIEKYGSLESLRIEGLSLTSVEESSALRSLFEGLSLLTTLEFKDCDFSDSSATFLASAILARTTLTSLILDDCGIDDIGAQALATALFLMPKLETLDLGNNDIGLSGLQFLFRAFQYMPNLTKLILTGNSFEGDPAHLETFIKTHFPQIEDVHLDYAEDEDHEGEANLVLAWY
jgi:Ran GTPase-activating protein (RanGAP) involved in mRNA processing and transport